MAGGTGFPFLFGFFGCKLWGMGEAQKIDIQVGADGKPVWPPFKAAPGSTLRITVETLPSAGKKRPLKDFIGCAKGSFSSPEEVDAFIRSERESWYSREGS